MLASRGLSAREIEVARLLALGHTNVEIAATLYLSVRTIEHHRASVFRKLRIHSRAALVSEMQRPDPETGLIQYEAPPRNRGISPHGTTMPEADTGSERT
jgi:DNA-binding CsgD family transcriptional regulator